MSLKKYLIMFSLCLASMIISSCGSSGSSGNNNNNASLVLTLSSSTVAAGKSVNATVIVSSTSGKSLSNLTPTIVSDMTDVVPSVTDSNGTNSAGVTNITLSSRNIKSTATAIKIYATLDGVRTNVVTLTVTPPILTLNPPPNTTFAQTSDSTTNLCAGGIVRFVTVGANSVFQDSSLQNIQGQQIDLSLISVTNFSGAEQVIFYPGGTNEITIPPFPVTVRLTTDTNGVVYLPVAIDGLIPTNKGGSNVFTLNWQATTQMTGDGGAPIIFTVTKQTQITSTCS